MEGQTPLIRTPRATLVILTPCYEGDPVIIIITGELYLFVSPSATPDSTKVALWREGGGGGGGEGGREG